MTEAVDRNRLVVVVCCTAVFMTTLDSTILNVALPSLQQGLHTSSSELQWSVDSYVLVRASSLFVCGAFSDRFGRLRLFRIGLSLFVGSSLACSLAPSIGVLIAFRAFQGVGSSLMTPASLAIITNALPGRFERARAIGAWSGTTGASMMAGPVLGGFLVEVLGWRSVFWVNIPIGLAALAATRLLDESRALEPRSLDLAGQLTIAGALATLTYALIAGPSRGWASPLVVILFVVSAACWAGFQIAARRVRHPLLDLKYLREPPLIGAIVAALVLFLAMGAFLFFNTLYLQEVRSFSPLDAGLLTAPATAVSLVVSPWSGRRTGRRGPLMPAATACGLVTVSMAVLAFVLTNHTPLWVLALDYLLLGAGYGLVNPAATYSVVSVLPQDQAAVAAAITSTARQVGTTLGVALVGAVVFSSGAYLGTTGHITPTTSAEFVAGLRHGYFLVTALSGVAMITALCAFRGRAPRGTRQAGLKSELSSR